MARPVILAIEWEDPTTMSEWKEVEGARGLHPAQIVSVGMLVSEDEKHLRIALDWSKDGSVNTYGIIPKGCITKRKELKLPRGIWKEAKDEPKGI